MKSIQEIVIVSAVRTPFGAFNGALSGLPAHCLGATAIRSALTKAALDPIDVDEVILGQVLTAGCGQNPARQAAMQSGIPHTATAWGVNQVCGSGLRAVALAAQQIASGEASIVVAGGQESMSMAPHAALLRRGQKMGSLEFIDTMQHDALTDAFGRYAMGVTAENVARRYGISRDVQDAFAAASQAKAAAAQSAGRFDLEIAPVRVPGRKGEVLVDKDEYPRPETNISSLSALMPAFDREGTVTAGNASGINDGAAAVVLMTMMEAKRRGLVPLGRIVATAVAGVDPALMGIGPVPASRKALERAGWNVRDLDLVEANEAFAAQACAVQRELGLDPAKVNVNGGAIALGHPVGASGARVLVTLLHELQRTGAARGLATLCIGGGMGIAMCIESGSGA